MNVHFTEKYLLDPQHPVSITLVGVGGTGSQVLTSLARMHLGLQSLGHPGLHVTAFDPDEVTIANVGRQMYSHGDIGLNKSIISIQRVNRYFGLGWIGVPVSFGGDISSNVGNILITCVDSAKARIDIGQHIENYEHNRYPFKKLFYWMDFGNLKTTGQVVIGTHKSVKQPKSELYTTIDKLPSAIDMLDFASVKEEDQGPSCSLAEAIGKQDLFINSTLANMGMNLLWKLFTDGKIEYHGLFLNLGNMQTRPIKI